jgi:hypothetical protein
MKRLLTAPGAVIVLQLLVTQAFAGHGHSSVSVHYGTYGPGWGYWGGYGGCGPAFGYSYHAAPVYYGSAYNYTYSPGYAVSGGILGGLLGGIIGHSTGCENTWEGAAIGTAAGLVLGSIADAEVYRKQQRVYSETIQASSPVYSPATPAPAASRAPSRQIADAPRVPDAPRVDGPTVNSLFGR